MSDELHPLPGLFIERLRQIIPQGSWHAVASSFSQSRPTTFRVNCLKASVRSVRESLQAQGLHLEPVRWYAEAFILRRGTLRQLQETPAYQQGWIYVQSLSSMLPALVLDPQPGESVLDLTAAPGSKSTQMACLMQGKGRIVANDNNRIRFYKLQANIQQQAAANVTLSFRDGTRLGREYPEAFDRVLVDAPCSAEGRFQVQENASYRYWKPAKIHQMAWKQKQLLASGLLALRPGGLLVYATCTFAPEENEAVVDWALRQFHEVASLDSIASRWVAHLPGLSSWQAHSFDPRVCMTARILPSAQTEGFFIARFRKMPEAPTA